MSHLIPKPILKLGFFLFPVLIFVATFSAQQTPPAPAQETQPAPKTTPPAYAAIPVQAAKQANPVKSTARISGSRQEMVDSRLRHVP